MLSESFDVVPQCARDPSKLSGVVPSTVAIKLNNITRAVIQWVSVQTSLKEAHSVALVHHQSSYYYLLITPTKTTSNFCSYQRRTRTKLEELGATIEWIRPFDRHLQRLFGWGDAWSKEIINNRADDDQRVAWKGDGMFYVHNSKSMRNDLKVEWLRDEIGNNNASLAEFADRADELTNTYHIFKGISSTVFDLPIWPSTLTEVDDGGRITKLSVTSKQTWEILNDEILRKPEFKNLVERNKVIIMGSRAKSALRWSPWSNTCHSVEYPSLWRMQYKKSADPFEYPPAVLLHNIMGMSNEDFWKLVRDGRFGRITARKRLKPAGEPVPPSSKRSRTPRQQPLVLPPISNDDIKWTIVDVKLMNADDLMTDDEWNTIMDKFASRFCDHEAYEAVVLDGVTIAENTFAIWTDMGSGTIEFMSNMWNKENDWKYPHRRLEFKVTNYSEPIFDAPPEEKRKPGLARVPPPSSSF